MVTEIEDISIKLKNYTQENPTPQIDYEYESKKIENLDIFMESIGFKFLDSGLDRRVYSNNSIAIKIEVGNNNQNKKEITNIPLIPENLRKYYNLPIAYDKIDFNWLIAPLAKTNKYSQKIAWKTLKQLKESYCIGYDDISDSHNIGLVDNQPKIIDYGW